MNSSTGRRGRAPRPQTGAKKSAEAISQQPSLPLTGLKTAIANADPFWMSGCRHGIEWLAQLSDEFTAYDVSLLGVPDPSHPSYWGAAFRKAQQDGLIEKLRDEPSRRPTRSAGRCGVWRGVPRAGERV